MAVQWTAEQLEAIKARGSNILVAAAAGSGKTAVLVERIIRRICDEEDPVSVDRLLVLTFTEAAAAEMKRKIAQAIYERLQQDPDNQRLREQNVLVHSAHISTIHSFCKTMIQNHIHETQIPTDFTLIDPAENEMLRNQALEQVLERYYKRISKKHAFRDLAVGYGGIKSDDDLRNTVLSLHNFVQSLARPKRWLYQTEKQYRDICNNNSLSGSVWEEQLIERCRQLANEAWNGYRAIANLVRQEVPADIPVYTYFAELPERFYDAFEPVLQGTASIEEICQCQDGFQKGRALGMNKIAPFTAARIESMRKKLVNAPLDEMKELLAALEDNKVEQVMLSAPRIQVLKQLVRQTERLHQAMKRERSALDFNDLEHELLRLLMDNKGNPTAIARNLQNRFVEILVDEYQDTNDIQDTIFRMLSREEKNVFMVGDLKQCIYQFRNAKPDIFARKYHRYLQGDGGRCIRLFQNFRSRKDVIDCVNGVFHSLMTEQLGGIPYTREEYLMQGADYPQGSGNTVTELLVTDADKEHYHPDGKRAGWSSYQLEAETVARRISQLIENRELLVTDKETKALRPLRLGDITILMQTSTHMREVSEMLEEYGIPVADTTGRRYLDSLEVMTVLNFLQIIDNPLQDIPLLAVLRSAMFDFSADELAQIRLLSKGNFYTALVAAAEQGNARAVEFLQILKDLRDDAVSMGVDELIWKICHELHFMALAGAMPGGKLRQENLNLLYEQGTAFEQGVLHGLFHFIGYIETLRAGNADVAVNQTSMQEKDMVSISTIHKSKGLEYPVVILFGMEQYFMEKDAAKPIIWDERFGIAMDWVDTVNRVRYTGLPKRLVQEVKVQEQRSEEMRLLYVALTRAREKLILSCSVGKSRNRWKETVYEETWEVAPSFAKRCTSMRDWMLGALLPHPKAEPLRKLAEREDIPPNPWMDFALSVAVINQESTPLETPVTIKTKTSVQADVPMTLSEDLEEQLSYIYPHAGLGLTPIKLSISEVKRRQMPEEDYNPGILRLNRPVLTNAKETGAAERGTITHYVMQHLDESHTESPEQVQEQLDEMVASGLISKRQREAVLAEQLYAFFAHPLGVRLKKSKEVCREFDFYMQIPAAEISKNLPSKDGEEAILLQGVADCFFYEDDGVVLIDYKTDRIAEGDAANRARVYRTQMECYERGLSAILPCPVKEKYLYFFHCKTAVAI